MNGRRFHDQIFQALGEAIHAFGQIERVTYTCLDHLSHEQLHIGMRRQSFSVRLDMIRHLCALDDLRGDPSELLKWLAVAKDLEQTRNLIAHNPWSVYFTHDPSTGASEFGAEIQSPRNVNRIITPPELRSFVNHCRQCVNEIENALASLAR